MPPLSVPTGVRPGSLESPIPGQEEQQQLAASVEAIEPVQQEFPQQDISPQLALPAEEPVQPELALPQPPREEPGLARFKQARPSSLPPAPGSSGEDSDEIRRQSVDDLAAEFAMETPPEQRAQVEDQAEDQIQDAISRIDRLLEQPASPEQRNLLRAQMIRAKKLGLTKEEIESRLTQPELEEPSFGRQVRNKLQDAAARFRAGLGRNDAEVRRAIVSSFGQENVEMRNGEFFVRRSSKEDFRPLDPGGFGFDLLLDVFADFSGPIIEGAVALPIEAGATAAGFVTGGPVGAAAGLVGGGAVGGAAGTAVREGLIQGLDLAADEAQRADDVDFGNELMWSAGIGGAVPAGLAGVAKTAKAVSKVSILGRGVAALKDFIGKPQRLAKEFFDLNNQLSTVLDDAGARGVGLEDAAAKTHGALEDIQEGLQSGVGAVRNKVRQMAGDEKFDPQFMMRKMQEHLDDNFATFDKNTGVYSMPDFETAEARSALGSRSGMSSIRNLVDDYNSLLSARQVDGGVDVKTLENFITKYKNLANVENATPDERLLHSSIRGAGTSDRNQVFSDVLARNPEDEASKLWNEDVFSQYNETIDDIRDLRKTLGSEKGARAVSRMMKPDNVNQIKKLRRVLGESSQEWETMRGEWLARQVEDSKDAVTGVFNGESFLKKIKKYDKETLNQLIEPDLLGRLTVISKRFADVPFGDLVKTPGSKQLVQDVAALTMSRQLFPQTKIRILMRLFGPNVDNIEAIMKGGLESVERMPTQKKRNSLMQGLRDMRQFLSNMRKQKVTRTNRKGEPQEMEVFVPFGRRATAETALELKREALDPGVRASEFQEQPQLEPIVQ